MIEWPEVERRRTERRQVADRRLRPGRRAGGERRRPLALRQSPTPYTTEEICRIREMVLNPSLHVGCPRCDGDLMLGPRRTVWEVHCSTCHRGGSIIDPR